MLADDARWLRERLAANGVPPDAIERHLGVLGNKEAMEAALAWYRARGAIRGPLGPIRVPTLYIWGDADDTVGRAAAEGTVDFIAAPYRFEALPDVGHFAADQAPERVCELMLERIRGASRLRNATHTRMLSCTKRSMTTWPAYNPSISLPHQIANCRRSSGQPGNSRKSPRRWRAMAWN